MNEGRNARGKKKGLSITEWHSVKGRCFCVGDNSWHSYGASKTKKASSKQFAIMFVIIYRSAAANENNLVTKWSKCGVK
jgi:hypothetical protein